MSDSKGSALHYRAEDLSYLRSTTAIRERCNRILSAALDGKTHFHVHLEKLPEVADRVVAVTQANYPTLDIPFHSRWNHFRVSVAYWKSEKTMSNHLRSNQRRTRMFH